MSTDSGPHGSPDNGTARPRPGPVGLCGIGNMGTAIAMRLAEGPPVLAYDPDPQRAEAAGRMPGVNPVGSLEELAHARCVVLSLPDPETSLRVCSALAPALPNGAVVIETSTVTPSDARRAAEVCRASQVRFVDVAVLAGVAQMASGRATLLTGGDSDDLDAVADVLSLLGARSWHFGPVGAAMAAKVANNAVAHAVMVLLVEAVAMAQASGVPPRRMADLLADPDAGLTRPLTHRLMERVLHEDYDGGMPTAAARKDSLLALRMAHDEKIPLFVINAADTVYELAIAAGLGRHDYAAIARLWEGWSDRPLHAAGDDGTPDDGTP